MMRAFLFFCSPTHTGVLSQSALCFSTGRAFFFRILRCSFRPGHPRNNHQRRGINEWSFQSARYACTRRMCALCALRASCSSFKSWCARGWLSFFLLFKREKPCCCYCCSVYIWSSCWGISKDAHSTISHIEFVRAALKSSALPSFFASPAVYLRAHWCGTFLITLCGPRFV
jgi:hypothetical protein